MCEQMDILPDPAKMPLEQSEFPDEVQVAFFMFDLLSDTWDGQSGSYLGKNWAQCTQLFDLYAVDDPKIVLYFMKLYEHLLMKYRIERQEERRKQSDRKTQQAGKTYTHNVRG
jgi:hypothetical protein